MLLCCKTRLSSALSWRKMGRRIGAVPPSAALRAGLGRSDRRERSRSCSFDIRRIAHLECPLTLIMQAAYHLLSRASISKSPEPWRGHHLLHSFALLFLNDLVQYTPSDTGAEDRFPPVNSADGFNDLIWLGFPFD
jgi:hypothetical protein